mmetsp:Transcript_53648/g.166236  ORF Transcript_53648/g.166236 Transcript_53648/m.166236 type:complete len:234 (-) Transcript_53648:173-874(-)
MAQLGGGLGIFACDGHAVFNSTERLDFLRRQGLPVRTVPVPGTLAAPLGGLYHTALNTDVFVRVWKAAVRQGDFRRYDWTVKADPDSVFLPERLRQLVRTVSQRLPELERPGTAVCHACGGNWSSAAVYLNNCRFGLHGPLEVLSRGAVDAFASGLPRCEHLRVKPWGEDWFMDHCLQHLGARRVDEFRLLSEAHCGQHPFPCKAASVAFHPFKDVQRYLQCSSNAAETGEWP